MAPTKEELASRGKKAEEAVSKFLKRQKDNIASFDYQRQYDARSAGGRFQSQVGDYLLFRARKYQTERGEELYTIRHGVLEIKQVHHDFRLPNKNFSAEQIAKIRRREMAGADALILVFHTTTQTWRAPPFSIFRDEPNAPSWDLSPYHAFETTAEALSYSAGQFVLNI